MSKTEQIAVAAGAMLSSVCSNANLPPDTSMDEASLPQTLLTECPVDQRRSHEIDDEMRTSRLQLCTC
jgi:hypothetical protein